MSGDSSESGRADDRPEHATLDDRLAHRELRLRLFADAPEVRLDRYVLRRRIGRGAMGLVYAAFDPVLEREVALKVVATGRATRDDRVLQEARALARLSHPNVVAIHEVGANAEQVWLAMELVTGETLAVLLERGPTRSEVLRSLAQAARGLAAAHRAGLVHRDVKPANIVVGSDGRVRVVDFGLVEVIGRGAVSGMVGTPLYMAPEQFRGDLVDARADVFALCVVAYEALAGRHPFVGDDLQELARSIANERVAPLTADVPRELAAWIMAGLEREPSQRPADLDALAHLLERAEHPRPRRRSHTAVLAATVATFAVAIMLLLQRRAAALRAGDVDFAAMLDASTDDERLARAEGFLDAHPDAPPVREARAHASAGEILWARSCPDAALGLCIVVARPGLGVCGATPLGPALRRTREPTSADGARGHFEAAHVLAENLAASDLDPVLARAELAQIDDAFEAHLALEFAPELDFVGAPELSRRVAQETAERLLGQGNELIARYAAMRRFGDPPSSAIAAHRTGLIYESMIGVLMRAPAPAGANLDVYCERVRNSYVAPLAKSGDDTYAWCHEHASSSTRVDPAIAAACAERVRR